MRRFINADGYVNANGDMLGFNLYAYCSNNPIMNVDPTGEWSWSKFFSGAKLLATGLTAIATAATILTCGAAAPLMVAVAAVTLTAGTLTAVNGVAEVVEAGTDYNFVRDGVMGGNTQAYETYSKVTETVSEIGTLVCGTYSAYRSATSTSTTKCPDPTSCFVAETMVVAAVGLIPIENIEVGDMVYAHNPETGETELKEVVRVFRNESKELVHVTINGDEIVCTPTHPFYVPVKGWTAASELRAGDRLQLVNGEYVIVEQVQHEILEAPVTVYNFEVEDFHTYYVGDAGVLVHNKCGDEWRTIRESSSAVNKTKGMSPSQYQNYENTLTKLSKGDMSGLNIHVSKGGHFSADIPGFGKGRGNGRILYEIKDGIIDIIDITLKHFG